MDYSGMKKAQLAETAIPERRIWLRVAIMFLLLCILAWLNEIVDLPHLLLGALQTPINWREAIIETVLIASVGLFVVLRLILDITERTRAEETVRASERRFRALTENSADGIALLDATGAIRYESPTNAQALGYSVGELVGTNVFDLVHPDDVQNVSLLLSALVEKPETPLTIQFRFRHQDGSWCWLEATGNNLLAEPAVQAIVVNYRDITERKRTEEALRESEEKFRTIFESVPISMIVIDKDGIMVEVSPHQVVHTARGLTPREGYIGKSLITHPTIVNAGLSDTYRRLLKGEPFDLKDVYFPSIQRGTEGYYFNIKGVPLFKEGEVISAITVHEDITERKRAEEALRESEEKYRSLVENSIDGIAIVQGLEMKFVNQALLEIFGYQSEDEMVGHTFTDFISPEFRNLMAERARAREKGEDVPSHYEFKALRKDGTEFDAEISVSPIVYEGSIARQGIIRDITERKRAEETLKEYSERLEEMVEERTAALRDANAQLAMRSLELQNINAELEAFAYSVSHDLRAPLRAINGFAHIIANRHRDSLNKEGQHYFDNIVQASEHMGRLIDDLLRYSRLGRTAVRRQPVPLGDVLARVTEDLAGRVAETQAHLNVADDLPIVRGDETLLGQIFTNLLDNALTYHRPGVSPRVVVGCQAKADRVIISVADRGIGIPPEFHQKIFNIFQRLHSQDEYPGTGVGLAIVKKAAGLLGGRVWVESVLGEGSTFFVELPRNE